MLTINIGFCRSKLCPRFSKKFYTTLYVSFLEPITSKPLIAIVNSNSFTLINYDLFERSNDVVIEYELSIDHEIYGALMHLIFSKLGYQSLSFSKKALAELVFILKLPSSKSIRNLKKQLKLRTTYELV